jgi:hypothetical protein
MRGQTRVLLTAAAASLAVALCATSSQAVTVTTWTVTPGGSFSSSNHSLQVTDTTRDSGFDCNSSGLSGRLKSGSGLPGSNLGSIGSITDGDCMAPAGGGLAFSGYPYVLTASSYSSGTTTGRITGIHANGTGLGCTFVIDGTSANADNGYVVFTYSNSTGKLKLSGRGNLHVYQVTPGTCFGLLSDGDHLSLAYTAPFELSPEQTITSP